MGSKDEEIILIHATVQYNERCSSVETHFFSSDCSFSLLPPSVSPTLMRLIPASPPPSIILPGL